MAKKVIDLQEKKQENETVELNEQMSPEQAQAAFLAELKQFEGTEVPKLSLTTPEGHKVVFVNPDEAIIYGSEYQKQNPEVIGFTLESIFSVHTGMAITINPIIRDNEEQALDFVKPELLKIIFAQTMQAKEMIENGLANLTKGQPQ